MGSGTRVPQAKVVLRFAAGATEATADVYLFGATLTSWTVAGQEQLFVRYRGGGRNALLADRRDLTPAVAGAGVHSSQAVFNGSNPIRGGIPIVFRTCGHAEAGLRCGSPGQPRERRRHSSWPPQRNSA